MVRARHPEIADIILRTVEARDEVPSVQAINRSVDGLPDVGLVPPTWEELAREAVHPPTAEDGKPNQQRVGVAGRGRSRSGVIFPGKSDSNPVRC